MQTIKFNIIKHNRVWVEATKDGYKCKIKADDSIKDLLGEVEILVKDISIRSRYGTDLRYEVVTTNQNKIFFKHDRYNKNLVKDMQNLGAVWDAEYRVWVASEIVSDAVDALEEIYNSKKVVIEITSKEEIHKTLGPVTFCGYVIAEASGRDSGAVLGTEVYKISGSIHSGGSIGNWATVIKSNSVFRTEVPEKLLEQKRSALEQVWDIKIVS